jgi:DedD protein
MATAASTEASEIRRRGRQRLIGAIAIVLLLVVFVPMFLESEPRPVRNEPALAIPPKENPPPLPEPPPAASAAPTASAAPAASTPSAMPTPSAAPSPSATPAPSEPSASGAAPVSPPAAIRATEPPKPASVTPLAPSKGAPAAAAKLEGFAVQVGAFRDDEKLRQAREKLGAAGIAHYTERLDTSSGPLTRLRAGPFATRAAAEAAVARLRGQSMQGRVVALP